MVDAQHVHHNFFSPCWGLLPELAVAERLWCSPERLLRKTKLGLVLAKGIKACGNIGEIVVANAVIAATAAVGGIAGGIVCCGPGRIRSDWIHVGEYDIRAGCILFKVVVLAIQAKRDGVVRVKRFD